MEMEQRLVKMDESIQLNPAYIQKVIGPLDEEVPPQDMVPTINLL